MKFRVTARRSAAAFSHGALLVCLCALLAGGSPAGAAPADSVAPPPPPQGPPPPAVPPIIGVNDPRNPLHLTADQQKQFIAKKMQLRAEGLSLIADKSMTKDQKDKKFAEESAAAQAELRAILTPAQQAQVTKQQGAEKKVMAMRAQSAQQYQALNTQLKATITPAQKASLIAIDGATRKQGDAIQTSTALNPAQKQSKLMQLEQLYKTKIDSVLNTPVQKRLMQQLVQLRLQEQSAEMKAMHP